MNRILALQGLSSSPLAGMDYLAGSDQSNNCSSATTACSTTSNLGCGKDEELAW